MSESKYGVCAVCEAQIPPPVKRYYRPPVTCGKQECILECKRYGAKLIGARNHRAAIERIAAEFSSGEGRQCRTCKTVYPDIFKSFAVKKREANGDIVSLARQCKKCDTVARKGRKRTDTRTPEEKRATAKYYKQKRMSDPEKAEAARKVKREYNRKWRAANPDKYAAEKRRQHERIRADPERYEEHLAKRRISYRLRQERKGREVVRNNRAANGGYREEMATGHDRGDFCDLRLPVKPLAMWLEAAERSGLPRTELSAATGINEKRLYDAAHEKVSTVNLKVADRLIWMHPGVAMEGVGEIHALEDLWPELEAIA